MTTKNAKHSMLILLLISLFAIVSCSKTADEYMELGRKSKDPDKALEYYGKALELNQTPKFASKVFVAMAAKYDDKKDDSNAVNYYKKAIEIDPENGYAFYEFGMFYMNKAYKGDSTNKDKAVEYLKRGAKLGDKWALGWYDAEGNEVKKK